MEKWDILNSNGRHVGKTVVRGKSILSSGEYHLVVHIWVESDDGKYLIQRRSEQKRLMPGEWAATGGAAVAGEDSFTAARRELLEELGIKSTAETLKFVQRIKRRNAFVDIWKIKTNISVSELTLQKNEVSSAKWVDKDTLLQMIKEGKFHDYGKYYWDVVLGIREKAEVK